MMQRCSGRGATKRHMKLVRSAMLFTGFGLIGSPVFLLFCASGKPQVMLVEDARAILLAHHHALPAGIDVALAGVEVDGQLRLEDGGDFGGLGLRCVEVAHGATIAAPCGMSAVVEVRPRGTNQMARDTV